MDFVVLVVSVVQLFDCFVDFLGTQSLIPLARRKIRTSRTAHTLTERSNVPVGCRTVSEESSARIRVFG